MSSEIVHEQSSQLIVVKPISRATVILGVREKSGTTDEHTAYKIVCEKPGGSRYVVLKRFSDFYRLRTAVTKTLGRIDPGIKTIIGHALYAFPKRRYFNNLSDEVVSERVLALNTFLSLLLEELPSPNAIEPLLGDFLMPQMDTDTVKAMQRTSAKITDASESRRKGSTTSVPDFDVQVKMLPLWIYLFNPWTETADQLEGGKRLPFGRLYVHVIGASGLMASDYAMFSKPSSDPYCQIEVGAIEKEIAKTHKINATLNPNWDEEFVMNVWRPRAILTLKVYDYDTASKDDHIGEVHVPIEMLRNQELHDLWFDLHPEPSDLRTEKAQKASLGRIRVRLQYKFSHLGEYLAHFLEKEIPEPEPFNVNRCYKHGMRTAALLTPVVDFCKNTAAVVTWEHPFLTCLVFAVYAFVCLNSRYLLPICHLPFITFIVKKGCYRYLILQYTKYGTKGIYGRRYMGKLPSAEEIGLMKEFIWDITSDTDSDPESSSTEQPAPLSRPSRTKSNNSVQDTGPKGKKVKDPEKDGLGATGTALNTLFAVIPSLKGTLQDVQNGIVHVNEELEDIYSVFDWSNPTVTRDVLLILIVTAIATSFVDLNYLLLAGGAIGLFCTSQIGQKVILFFKGIGKYTKTLRYKEFETSGNVHADAEIQKKIYRDIRRRTRSSTMEQTLRTKSQGHPKTASKT